MQPQPQPIYADRKSILRDRAKTAYKSIAAEGRTRRITLDEVYNRTAYLFPDTKGNVESLELATSMMEPANGMNGGGEFGIQHEAGEFVVSYYD